MNRRVKAKIEMLENCGVPRAKIIEWSDMASLVSKEELVEMYVTERCLKELHIREYRREQLNNHDLKIDLERITTELQGLLNQNEELDE